MTGLWLYLHFPCLQLDALYPALSLAQQRRPIAILDTQENSIVQINASAQHCGIRLGMGLGCAAALHRGLQVVEYKREIEIRKLEEIAHWLYTYTSDISFWPPNGLLLRIHGMLSMYGGLQNYWQVLERQLQIMNLQFHYACGCSPLAARMLALAGHNLLSDDQHLLQAKVDASPLSQTDLDAKTRQQLERVGIKRVEQLSAIAPAELAKRFDIQLVTYLGRLKGGFSHPVHFYHPPETFCQYLELMYEIENSQVLIHPVTRLLYSLEGFLRLRDRLTCELCFRFSLRDRDALTLIVQSAQGEYRAEYWQRLTSLKLENLVLSAPVYAIELSVEQLMEKEGQGRDLFEGKRGVLNAAQLLSMLQAKLGAQAVCGLGIHNDIRPEFSSGYCSPLQRAEQIDWRLPGLRPSLLLDPPSPLEDKVSLLHGPERIQTGWWDNHAMTRDYFIARTEQGQWLWVFRTPEPRWYIHGLFS